MRGRARATVEFHNRMMLSRPQGKAEFDESGIDWNLLAEYSTKNKTLVRLSNKLESSGFRLPEALQNQLETRRERNANSLRVIGQVSERLDREGITFSMLKFADSFPDMGRDNDFFVGDDFDRAVRVVLGMGTSPNTVSLSDMINRKKKSFFLDGVEVELYGKVTQFGEDYLPSEELLADREWMNVGSLRIPVPPASARLLYSCIHSMLRHRYVKFSEVLGAMQILRLNHFRWEHTILVARRAGIILPLRHFLMMVSHLNRAYQDAGTGIDSLPTWMKMFPAHTPKIDFVGFYGSKFFADLVNGDIASAVKLTAAPLVGTLSELTATLTRSQRGVW